MEKNNFKSLFFKKIKLSHNPLFIIFQNFKKRMNVFYYLDKNLSTNIFNVEKKIYKYFLFFSKLV